VERQTQVTENWDEDGRSEKRETKRMKKHTQELVAEVPRGCFQVGMTIGIDLGMSGAITARSTKLVK